MANRRTFTMTDGVRVVAPDSLGLITPYVLREQLDWFEDELRFLRRALQPGQRVVDIGANYGVYTLSLAKAVGPQGHVRAFEPASATAAFLRAGVEANGFAHVTVVQAAISAAPGEARFRVSDNAELNALAREGDTGPTETVRLDSLDACMARGEFTDIDFLKIDAEGEEENILRGAAGFLGSQSPLVQYEIVAGSGANLALVADFARAGYASYRLVPGLGVLVPFDPAAQRDGFLLNLFACKPDRAAKLEERGLLVRAQAGMRAEPSPRHGWRETLAAMPYALPLAAIWGQAAAMGWSGEVERALALHGMSRDEAVPIAERHAALMAALATMQDVCTKDVSFLRLATLARIAQEAGERELAIRAWTQQQQILQQSGQADPREPFLAPSVRFESIPPGASFPTWILAGLAEEFERLNAFSSFYTGTAGLPRLELIARLGHGSEEMQRRLALVRERFPA